VASSGSTAVVDERVEGELLAQVLEEVLLAPPLEHPEGHLGAGQVAARGDDGRLMPLAREAGDLSKAQLAAEETDALVGEFVRDALAVEDGGLGREAASREAVEAALAVGEEVESRGDEITEELGAPAAAVEDDGDAAIPGECADLFEQLGQHGDHAGVCLGGDNEERLAPGIVRPVVGGRREGDAHPSHVRLRDLALAVVDAHVAIDVEEAERGAEGRDAPLGEEAAEERGAAAASQARQLAA